MPSTTYLLASLYTTAKTLLVRARTSRGSPQMNKVFRALGVPVSPAIARCFFTVARVDVYSADDFALGRFANDRCRNYARGPMSRRCRSASASICTFVFPPYFFFFFFYLILLSTGFANPNHFGFLAESPPGEFSPRSLLEQLGVEEVAVGFLMKRFIRVSLFVRTRRIFWESRISIF